MPAWNHIRKRSRQPALTAPHLRNVLSAGGGFLPSPKKPHSGKTGGLHRSVQHLLAVYLPEFENPKFFLDADLSAAPPRRVLLENTRSEERRVGKECRS